MKSHILSPQARCYSQLCHQGKQARSCVMRSADIFAFANLSRTFHATVSGAEQVRVREPGVQDHYSLLPSLDIIISAEVFVSLRSVCISIRASLCSPQSERIVWLGPSSTKATAHVHPAGDNIKQSRKQSSTYTVLQTHKPSLSSRWTMASCMTSARPKRTRCFFRCVDGARTLMPPCWRWRLFSLS